ncbi:MAG: Valyl-tRNA ligase [Candidatus Tokpelaia hoelldobleri]|uniref:Valine--tRNA ligase n=1 Tax=Candidatus Tokpelaia hoelldobleri TaxID=1902579 RepID=A0A1U9JTN4_9HYPH|nr:MAG: Valyl-tRNA ligase [Candidatus Tokpelaia hoelldoblerii]
MLDKTYDAKATEPQIARAWDEAGAFKAGAGAKPGAEAFSIVIPPPNVTGSLHMGHALNNTIQDILVRFERMRGKNVLWQPGMDHAGIATQMVVERQLAAKGEPGRREMGREKFVERIWQWREESGGMIARQLKRLGASCDWSRERFTMDEGLSKAVLEVFVTLYEQGLIYKDKRLVNWDPKLLTAISDLEVEPKEMKGHLWHFRYPLEGAEFDPENPSTYIIVATTRPETMLGDSGIAVNPKDPRYQHLIGKYAVLPLVGRKLLIVGDDYADPEAGSGAVKITPAHDFNDFKVGSRNNLRVINIMDQSAAIVLKDNAEFLDGLKTGAALEALVEQMHGMDRFAARKQIVAMMEEGGYLQEIEAHLHKVPHGDRSGVIIEPLLTDQWYVNAAELAKPALSAVRGGKVAIIPQGWEKTYYNWMENIEPWCISRQLWWGHQIPAWYGPDGHIFVEKSEEDAQAAAKAHYGKAVKLTRDGDVLDTWFSSALWPFSTLGWPEKTPELATYYPTSVLVTGFDIIFFWVARMMMMGLHFMDEAPFHTVYVHALVRDKHGAKMSKSKGNVIDPLDLMDEYGTDALRFTLAIMAAQGRDVKLDPARIAGYRNFGTKLWNATRFAEMNGVAHDAAFVPEKATLAVNRWILTELTRAAKAVTENIAAYRFNDAAAALYRFVWHLFCDWYLELIKPILQSGDATALAEVRGCVAYALDGIYKLLHPFMPFMTEELWARTAGEGQARPAMLALTQWPDLQFIDEDAAADLNWLVELVSGIRSLRVEMNVPAGAQAPLVVFDADALTKERIARHELVIKRLARLEIITFAADAPAMSAQVVLGAATFCLPLGDLIDLDAEKARLNKELSKIALEISKIGNKLDNDKFVANAKPEVVEAERERFAECMLLKEKTEKALARLSAG